nr:UDP-glucuronate:xylan alpha-glucuronosyltransferase 2 isoform X1 [Tanacetum cinerariifolium]
MWKVTPSKSLVIRINLVFLSCFLVIYATILLRPSTSIYHESASAYVRCSLRDCHHKVETGYKMKAVLLEDITELSNNHSKKIGVRKMVKREKPSFLNGSGFMGRSMRMGMVNVEGEDLSDWNVLGKTIPVMFEKVSENFEWKDLFPEWIDEEEEMHGTLCPELPMPDYKKYGYMDMIVVNIPCKYPAEGWARDVFRLQLHMIAANMAVRRGRKSWNRKPKVVVSSKCQPMVEIFRCDDLLIHDGDWWYYEPDMKMLEQKVYLPIGTCNLALPLWGKDLIFSFPQMSAVGNDNSIFNSGIMVIEPSNCTFMHFMQQTNEIVSYNGGDQGFLNEIFVYWRRLPRRINFLKNFWSNTTVEYSMKNQLFGADPPKLYAIHYLGFKPWVCYRDYDCNWDIGDQRVYASDVAHRTWWKLHDTINGSLKSHCNLTKQRRIELKWDRMQAKKIGFSDEHWRINVTDPRRRG